MCVLGCFWFEVNKADGNVWMSLVDFFAIRFGVVVVLDVVLVDSIDVVVSSSVIFIVVSDVVVVVGVVVISVVVISVVVVVRFVVVSGKYTKRWFNAYVIYCVKYVFKLKTIFLKVKCTFPGQIKPSTVVNVIRHKCYNENVPSVMKIKWREFTTSLYN